MTRTVLTNLLLSNFVDDSKKPQMLSKEKHSLQLLNTLHSFGIRLRGDYAVVLAAEWSEFKMRQMGNTKQNYHGHEVRKPRLRLLLPLYSRKHHLSWAYVLDNSTQRCLLCQPTSQCLCSLSFRKYTSKSCIREYLVLDPVSYFMPQKYMRNRA